MNRQEVWLGPISSPKDEPTIACAFTGRKFAHQGETLTVVFYDPLNCTLTAKRSSGEQVDIIVSEAEFLKQATVPEEVVQVLEQKSNENMDDASKLKELSEMPVAPAAQILMEEVSESSGQDAAALQEAVDHIQAEGSIKTARNFDGTGPAGKGPGTGRGLGPCRKGPRKDVKEEEEIKEAAEIREELQGIDAILNKILGYAIDAGNKYVNIEQTGDDSFRVEIHTNDDEYDIQDYEVDPLDARIYQATKEVPLTTLLETLDAAHTAVDDYKTQKAAKKARRVKSAQEISVDAATPAPEVAPGVPPAEVSSEDTLAPKEDPQLAKGIEVEQEHVDTIDKMLRAVEVDPGEIERKHDKVVQDVVKEIAEDHLEESSVYYDVLEKAEDIMKELTPPEAGEIAPEEEPIESAPVVAKKLAQFTILRFKEAAYANVKKALAGASVRFFDNDFAVAIASADANQVLDELLAEDIITVAVRKQAQSTYAYKFQFGPMELRYPKSDKGYTFNAAKFPMAAANMIEDFNDTFSDVATSGYMDRVPGILSATMDNINGPFAFGTVVFDHQLTSEEMQLVKDDIEGQASDGWGEGYEQRPASREGHYGVDIYVSPWGHEKWFVRLTQLPSEAPSAEADTDEGDASVLQKTEQRKVAWRARVQDVYESLDELQEYDEPYNIAQRVGYSSVEELWEANPILSGSVHPEDLRVIKGKSAQRKQAFESDPQYEAAKDFVKDAFFGKGNRWTSIAEDLIRLYPTLTPEAIEGLKHDVAYQVGQLQMQIESAKRVADKDEWGGRGPGFDNCVDYFMHKSDFEARGDRTKRESAEALCAYIAKQKGGTRGLFAQARTLGFKLAKAEVHAIIEEGCPCKKQARFGGGELDYSQEVDSEIAWDAAFCQLSEGTPADLVLADLKQSFDLPEHVLEEVITDAKSALPSKAAGKKIAEVGDVVHLEGDDSSQYVITQIQGTDEQGNPIPVGSMGIKKKDDPSAVTQVVEETKVSPSA